MPGGSWNRLTSLEGLRLGQGGREPAPRRPVDWQEVLAVWPFVSGQVWAMILLQWLTGARSGEVVRLCGAEIERKGKAWTWRPRKHKGEIHGLPRLVAIGPLAQRAIKPWLKKNPEAPLFQPGESEAARHAALVAERKARGGVGNHKRIVRRPRRRPGAAYTVASYRRAIARACEDAGVSRWTPHQLRHSCATRVRRRFGLEAARAVLGHAAAGMTLEYAELDLAKAAEAAAVMG